MIMVNTVVGFLVGVGVFTTLSLLLENFRELRRPQAFDVEEIEHASVRG